VSRVRVAHCIGLTSPQFVVEPFISPQLRPEWWSLDAALAQYVMGCMLGTPNRTFSQHGELGWVHPLTQVFNEEVCSEVEWLYSLLW
jgi:hypothetical protein